LTLIRRADANKVFAGFFVIAMGNFRQILPVKSINLVKALASDPAKLAKSSHHDRRDGKGSEGRDGTCYGNL
jgi:hypothetical protein